MRVDAGATTPVCAQDPVERVMAWPVATVPAEASLLEVAEALAADEVGALVVLEAHRLAGVISERDVVAHLASGADPEHVTAGEAMATDLVTVGPKDSVLEAGRRMREAGLRHLPVIGEGAVVGMLSVRDVADVLVQDADTAADVLVLRSGRQVVVRAE